MYPLVGLDLVVVRYCAPDCVRGTNLKYSRCFYAVVSFEG